MIFRPQIISWEFATGRRRCAFTQRVPARASSQGKQQYAEAILAKSDIKGILSTLNRGLVTMDESTRQRFDCAVAALESLQKGTVATSNELLSANWELLWTTEKETLFILQWAKLFGTSAGGVFQVSGEQGQFPSYHARLSICGTCSTKRKQCPALENGSFCVVMISGCRPRSALGFAAPLKTVGKKGLHCADWSLRMCSQSMWLLELCRIS